MAPITGFVNVRKFRDLNCDAILRKLVSFLPERAEIHVALGEIQCLSVSSECP